MISYVFSIHFNHTNSFKMCQVALNKPDIGRFANFLAKIMKLFVNRSKSTFLYAINLSLGYFLFEKNFSHKKIQAATKKPDVPTFIFFCKIANKAAFLRRTLP